MDRSGLTGIGGRLIRLAMIVSFCVVCLSSNSWAVADESKPTQGKKPVAKKDVGKVDSNLAPLEIKVPRPAFKGTPKHVPAGTNLEENRKGPRKPLLLPKGVKLLSANKPVIASDEEPIIGEIKFVTNGDKEAKEGSYVELGPGLQYVQIDLEKPHTIHAVCLWHFHMSARVYHDVVIQVADDKAFSKNVRTVFNNDHDNSSRLGIGKDKEFWDTFEGKLIKVEGVKGRYVRLYSNGSTDDDQNHYTEVEIFGL